MSNTFQDAIDTIFRQSSVYESPMQEIPQAIPVIVNHGSNNRQPQAANRKQVSTRSQNNQPGIDENQKRVLFLRDSIIRGVNPKGLVNGVHKHSNSGVTYKH